MTEISALLIGSGIIVLFQFLTTAFLYGRLVQDVKNTKEATKDLAGRMRNAETVLSGPGGHGERLTALEAWRIEHRGTK